MKQAATRPKAGGRVYHMSEGVGIAPSSSPAGPATLSHPAVGDEQKDAGPAGPSHFILFEFFVIDACLNRDCATVSWPPSPPPLPLPFTHVVMCCLQDCGLSVSFLQFPGLFVPLPSPVLSGDAAGRVTIPVSAGKSCVVELDDDAYTRLSEAVVTVMLLRVCGGQDAGFVGVSHVPLRALAASLTQNPSQCAHARAKYPLCSLLGESVGWYDALVRMRGVDTSLAPHLTVYGLSSRGTPFPVPDLTLVPSQPPPRPLPAPILHEIAVMSPADESECGHPRAIVCLPGGADSAVVTSAPVYTPPPAPSPPFDPAQMAQHILASLPADWEARAR